MNEPTLPAGMDSSVGLDVPDILSERAQSVGARILGLSVGLFAIGIGLVGTDGTTRLKLGSLSGEVGTSELSVFATAVLLATIAYFATLVNRDLRRFALANSEYSEAELLRVVESRGRIIFQKEIDRVAADTPELSRALAAERFVSKTLKKNLPDRVKTVETVAHGWSSFGLEVALPLVAGLLGILSAATKAEAGFPIVFQVVGATISLLFLVGAAALFGPTVFNAKKVTEAFLDSTGVEAGAWGYALNIAKVELPINSKEGKFYGFPVEKREELHDKIARTFFDLFEQFEEDHTA